MLSKRFAVSAVVLLIAAGITFAASEGSWAGWVTDNMCAAKGTSASHADCARKCVKEHGGKYALYIPADKKLYILEPQDKAGEHAGHYVTVQGTVEGDTIKFSSITMTPEPKGN